MIQLAARASAAQTRVTAGTAKEPQRRFCLAGGNRQVEPRPDGVGGAPERFQWHPVVGRVHQVENSRLGVVPKRQRQFAARGNASEFFGIPVSQRGFAIELNASLVDNGNFDRVSAFGPVNDP